MASNSNEFKIDYKGIATIILLVISIVGVVGNTLNIFVLSRKDMRKISTFRFLLYLSVIDLIVLLVCATDTLATFSFEFELRVHSTLTCRLQSFLIYYFLHMSSVLLMTVSVERVYLICNDTIKTFINNRRRTILLKKRKADNEDDENGAHQVITNADVKKSMKLKFLTTYINGYRVEIIVFVIAVILCLVNMHYLIYLNVNTVNINQQESLFDHPTNDDIILTSTRKSLKQKKKVFTKHRLDELSGQISNRLSYKQKEEDIKLNELIKNKAIMDWSEDTFEMCIPDSTSSYFKFLMTVWVWIDILVYSIVPFFVMVICTIIILVELKRKANAKSSGFIKSNKVLLKRKNRRDNQVLYMLAVTNIFFFVCSLPYCIFSYKLNQGVEINQTIYYMVYILSYLNNSANFILYGLFSSKYRHELNKMIEFFRKKFQSENTSLMQINDNVGRLIANSRTHNKNTNSKHSFIQTESSQIITDDKNQNHINDNQPSNFNMKYLAPTIQQINNVDKHKDTSF